MKFTRDWLFSHLETDRPLAEILDVLPTLGLEVESVVDRAQTLAPFIIAEVISAEQHPNADKLRVCMVNIGQDAPVQVVCGAPNARAGMKGVFAPVGAYVPGIDLTLKTGEIRGELSNGMLCSEREMQLSDEHDGIIDLAADAPVGEAFAAYAGLDDPVIEIAITPNRADCLGVRGVARDLAAAGYGRLKALDTSPLQGSFESPISWELNLKPEQAHLCPLVSGRAFTGLRNGASPVWMANRLTAIGQRPISALVDITNYIMIDLGRPLHAYDIDKIEGGKLIIGPAKAGQTMTALNEKTYELDEDMLVIGDLNGPDDLAGIMGGERSGVSDATDKMFLEIAVFDQVAVAATGRKLNIHSDARFRFERGLDVTSPEWASGYVARMVLEICGGQASHVVTAGDGAKWQREIFLAVDKVERLTGMQVLPARQQAILESLGFTVRDAASGWQVSPPPWRGDIDGAADLVEEISRIFGFGHLPMTHLPRENVVAQPAVNAEQARPLRLRRALAERGLTEAVTFSFLAEKEAAIFGGGGASLKLVNPISADLSIMRPSVLPNLLSAAARNQDRGEADVALFEIGPIFLGDEPDQQRTAVAAIRHGAMAPREWHGSRRMVDLFDAKADAEVTLAVLGVRRASLQVEAGGPDYFHPGRSGRLLQGRTLLAQFGEFHPQIAAHFGLRSALVGFELYLEDVPLAKSKGPARAYLKMSPFQPVSRDFAFILAEDVAASQLLRAVKSAAGPLVSDVQLFDVYQGKNIADGQKSLAVTITLTPQKATLSEAEIDAMSDAVIAAASKNCGAVLRG
ncbi:MAG: phenylalanine--tRNA ligase subunit beta [Candidatus Puniceispirillum sp.]|nr:phenylalanine--tRNA ligase subunit beta [Candidatus Puniceispirillum sp.]